MEQVARRTLSLLLKSKNSHILSQSVLLPGTAVYFHTKIGKYTGWTPGFVSQALPEYVGVRRQNETRGAILKIAYEDIRLAPHSSLLQELDALEHNSNEDPDPNEAPSTSSLLASLTSTSTDAPNNPVKDIGPVSSVGPTVPAATNDRQQTEQMLLKQIQAAIGDCDVSATQLQWAPTWGFGKSR